MVAHAFDVVDSMHECHDAGALRLGQVMLCDLREVCGYLLLHGVDEVLVPKNGFQQAHTIVKEGCSTVVHHLIRYPSHAVQLLGGLRQGD